MRSPRFAPVVFSIGFFALAAQTLLFRDFLAAFEGTELAIGGFFSSWLLWLSLGAACAGWLQHHVNGTSKRFYLVVLLYLPAFVVQHWLLLNARDVLGLAAFEAIGLQHILVFALLANSLVSFLTGFLFSFACDWSREKSVLPVAWVYAIETLGSFTGAVLVTAGLEMSLSPERLFLLSSLVLAGGFTLSSFNRSALWGSGITFALVLIVLGVNLDSQWGQNRKETQWGKLLPKESLHGSFSTPQSEYLYGEYHDEFLVMAWGSVGESLPNEEHSGEVLALSLAQNPQARRVLIIGQGGLALSRLLSRLPQVERITWCHFDPEFVPKVLKVLPARYRKDCSRIEAPVQDIASFIKSASGVYDLVLLNIPDPTTLVLNRFLTHEFLAEVNTILAENAVLGLRISGGANYLGPEYSYIGASALSTLHAVFPEVVMKPGDETWLLASRGSQLSSSPGELKERFAAIPGAASLYPPEGLLSLYLPGRVAFQTQKYREVMDITGRDNLMNSEARPLGLLYGLLLLIRTTGLALIHGIQVFSNNGLLILLTGLLLYGLLRITYVFREERKDSPAGWSSFFDSDVLIFTSGLAGISLNILLLFRYQSQFGSVFLEIGLISGVFMLGIFAGSEGLRLWLRKAGDENSILLPACLLAHLILLMGMFHFTTVTSKWVYGVFFFMGGIFTGIYVPIASWRAERRGFSPALSGAWLEGFDNLGGCLGGLFTGVLLIPVLGQNLVLLFLSGMMGVQLIPALLFQRITGGTVLLSTFDRRVRTTGYWLFGLGALSLFSSNAVQMSGQVEYGHLFENTAHELAGRETELIPLTKETQEGKLIHYFSCRKKESSEEHFILDSRDLGSSASGYGGPLHLAIRVDSKGTLVGFRVIESHETPSYLHSLENWFHTLTGRSLVNDSFTRVDAVTGATLTSRAVIRTLEQSGQTFAYQVLGIVSGPSETPSEQAYVSTGWRDGFVLLVFFMTALWIRRTPRAWMRRIWLVLMVVVCGGWLNLQFSSQQVFSLLSLQFPVVAFTAAFFLVVLLPVLTLLFGNIYCGHLCPFGALQELIGDLRPASMATDPSKRLFRYGRLVKYGLLFICVLAFSLSRDDSILVVDPLITFFGHSIETAAFTIALVVLVSSFFYKRFWCRNLCPAGAFLSLLNGVQLFKRWLPRTEPARCDLGVRRTGELDC